MRVLVIGGTAFVGRHLVEAALAAGHDVTIFNRGVTNPGLYAEAEWLAGDREHDLSALEGREFDAVVDTCAYVPRVARLAAELLAPRVERYAFVSTLSVYDDAPLLSESSPVLEASDPASEDVAGEYGALKVLCERVVEESFAGRALVVRPGLIVGPHDYTGRFGYWPNRIARGGEVLAPGSPGARIWIIDARDLAGWTIRMLESAANGIYNAVGPLDPLTLGGFLAECEAFAGASVELTWVPDAFLLEHGVAPYSELPLWLPAENAHPEIDVSKAVAAGLTFRPIRETIEDVLGEGTSYDERIVEATGRARAKGGLAPERERELLAAWHSGGS